jgi:hypothetical protein
MNILFHNEPNAIYGKICQFVQFWVLILCHQCQCQAPANILSIIITILWREPKSIALSSWLFQNLSLCLFLKPFSGHLRPVRSPFSFSMFTCWGQTFYLYSIQQSSSCTMFTVIFVRKHYPYSPGTWACTHCQCSQRVWLLFERKDAWFFSSN